MASKTGVVAGTGKLTGRFCVRVPVPKTENSSGILMQGCFKTEEAAKKKLESVLKTREDAKKKGSE